MPRLARRPPRSRLKTFLLGCGIGCGSVTVILLAVIGILYARITAVPEALSRRAPSPAEPVDRPQSSDPGVVQPPPALDVQAQAIKKAVESGQPARVSLRLNEAQINELIAQEGGSTGQLRDLRVILRDRDLLLTATTDWAGRQVYLSVAATPRASGGRLGFHVNSVRAGNLSLPGSVVARVQAEIDKATAQSAGMPDGVYVDDAAISGGELVISGQTASR